MVSCFLCGSALADFKSLKYHFEFRHSDHNFLTYKCADVDCNRTFHIFNSFKRHFQKQHMSANNEQMIRRVGESNASFEIPEDSSIPQNDLAKTSQPNPTTTISNTQMGTVTEALSLFIASLYGNIVLPRNAVQKVVDGLGEFVHSLAPIVQNFVTSTGDSGSSLSNSIESLMTSPLATLSTERKRLNHFKALGSYVEPIPIVIGQRLEKAKVKNILRIQPVECKEHFIPLRDVLKQFLSLEGLLVEILQYMDQLNGENVVITNFIQGTFWRNRMINNAHRIVIPLFMYFDDYETGNVLGSHSGIHKLGAVYFSIPCLPPWRSSVLSNIFLSLLFHSTDRTAFGNNVIFKPVIDEINFLSETGLSINIPTFNGTIFFELAVILGDNLGLHSMMGFTESFSANFSCRVCKVPKEILKVQCYEDESLLRNNSNYEYDLSLGDVSLTGIKDRCVWLDVKNFNLWDQVGVDVMHDILEGVAKYILSFMIMEYTQKKLFSLKVLNEIILAFDYGPDNKNKPCTLEKEQLTRGNVRQSSGEMLTLLRFFGLMVGDFIPRDDSLWSMYTALRKVLDVVLSQNISDGTSDLLQTLVAELNELYTNLTKTSLKPKFHNLVHYHSALVKYGPIVSLWSMRFEAKHRHSKMAARTSSNRINVTLTLAKKHQLQMNEIFLRGKLPDLLTSGPKVSVTSEEINIIRSMLSLDCEKPLIRVNWVHMSSIRYEKGSILVKDVCEENVLNFFQVEKIYLHNSERVIFFGNMLQTLGFDEHYFAYNVETTYRMKDVTEFLESFLSPIPNTKCVLLGGRHYIVLRSPI